MAKLDDVSLFIEDESESYKVDVTEYAVEKGEPFTDHVSKRSPDFSISGYILSSNYETSKNKLISIMESGKIIKYVGKMSASNVIITSISSKRSSDVQNGMAIDISLRRIRISTTSWQKASGSKKPVQKPTSQSGKKKPVSKKKPTSTKKYHVTKKGDTYWDLSRKYGSSIPQLRSWNKYPDRRIPIGVKLRVK
ncbi:LysM peptidoglycan-binding domain-containing protein [Peribacillus simplex]|uniref:LysM peptidoglycan-binding domain-containing protein n=1 Tax=Peribacillus simplex TaxID=1478 RepID=UPI0019240984|nr:LysM peptidoglycan-binding domain-containing protein [Peribacillus simplex]MBD8590257.1 LysM peptidoglycan-binding domain-containing protein [Peribacillus simplex]